MGLVCVFTGRRVWEEPAVTELLITAIEKLGKIRDEIPERLAPISNLEIRDLRGLASDLKNSIHIMASQLPRAHAAWSGLPEHIENAGGKLLELRKRSRSDSGCTLLDIASYFFSFPRPLISGGPLEPYSM